MKQFIIVVLLVLQASFLFAQQEKKYIRKGNEQYLQQNYKEAENSYRQSVGKAGKTVEGNFNLGDALYKQKKYADAGAQFNKIAATSGNNKAVMAKAYHNLGNSLLESKKLEESIAAYKKSLLNNPQDDETRYNLAYAQKKLQQQQDKKNQDNKNNKNNKDKNDKNKDKDKKDQDKKNDDKNKDDKDKKDQDKKDQDKDKQNQDKKDQDKKDQQNGQDPNNVSKDDAERMLEALNNDEKQTQDRLKNKKLKGAKVRIAKDW